MFIDDLITILEDADVGDINVDIFVGPGAVIPAGPGPYLTITQTGGSAPEGTHNSMEEPAYVRPSAQFYVRGLALDEVVEMANAAYLAVFPIRNQLVNGVWWRQVRCLQEPYPLGTEDGTDRRIVVFNISVDKRPN